MNIPKPNNTTKKQADTDRIYRLNPDGKWHKKTSKGNYEEMPSEQVLKRPQFSASCYGRRFE